ncbi:hypothetical protein [Streptococcus suis]|uniref:Uncharacterized protein n=1 Tax=Streptococcus suis TaxID=1307 RepID=A0A0Z8H7W5_STRSU|nr:hypothetical protein [Streptococcus suis]NQH67119.1 hypothetical protein [Streptococcus suis]CYV11952.1 Uncharacterised protein [Streptococcus suis]CYV31957.1 Uncharacterised protein [Streptococcus suis]HEP1805526.1 hypothetical protein [Streptococcus suis]
MKPIKLFHKKSTVFTLIGLHLVVFLLSGLRSWILHQPFKWWITLGISVGFSVAYLLVTKNAP